MSDEPFPPPPDVLSYGEFTLSSPLIAGFFTFTHEAQRR